MKTGVNLVDRSHSQEATSLGLAYIYLAMKNLAAIFLLACVSAISSSAQCVRDDVVVASLRGNVTDNTSKQSIPDVTVSVRKGNGSDGKLIAQTETDATGNFEISKLKRGQYSLSVTYPNFDRIVVRLIITKRTTGRDFLQIMLAPPDFSGTDSCEGDATVIRK